MAFAFFLLAAFFFLVDVLALTADFLPFLDVWDAARLTPAPPTGTVGFDAAEAEPSGLVATTVTRRRRPRSSLVIR